jgi:hypothetical protein
MSPGDDKAAGASGIENRLAARHTTVNFIWYKIIEDSDDSKQSDEGISKSSDISETGVGMLVTRLIPKGKKVFVEIATKDFNISAVGQIVYTKYEGEGFYRVGIQFLAVPPNDLLLLKKHFGKHG